MQQIQLCRYLSCPLMRNCQLHNRQLRLWIHCKGCCRVPHSGSQSQWDPLPSKPCENSHLLVRNTGVGWSVAMHAHLCSILLDVHRCPNLLEQGPYCEG